MATSVQIRKCGDMLSSAVVSVLLYENNLMQWNLIYAFTWMHLGQEVSLFCLAKHYSSCYGYTMKPNN